MREGIWDVDHFGEDIAMDKIKIAITGRVASVVALPEVVADNAEYEVNFALDPREGWDMFLPITALFVRRDGSYTARIMDAGKTSCTMPPQTGTNIVYVGLTQDDMRTTTPATIKVHRSIRTVANDPLPAPTEDVYAQILAAYAGIKILSGKGAPTSATQGKVNQLYRDEDTQRLYICTATDGGYTWAAVSSGGGSVDVDATLTKAGQAADAKAAGDAIGQKLDETALPTAINDALAQAKASGEFDGAKGDKGDTGPVGPKGADGKDGAGMDVTGAKVGQIVKITAVDATGKPTGWEPMDMPNQKTVKWLTVHTSDLAENMNTLVISADSDGKPIADYNPIALSIVISVPADSTQESSNGTIWTYPSATYTSNSIRVSTNVANWKNTARDLVMSFNGNASVMYCAGTANVSVPTYKVDGYILDGVKIYIHNNKDHLPVGTHVAVAILCEV